MNSYYSRAVLLFVVAAIVSALVMTEAWSTLAHYWDDTLGGSKDRIIPTLAGFKHGAPIEGS
jgi:hypothetical protein